MSENKIDQFLDTAKEQIDGLLYSQHRLNMQLEETETGLEQRSGVVSFLMAMKQEGYELIKPEPEPETPTEEPQSVRVESELEPYIEEEPAPEEGQDAETIQP